MAATNKSKQFFFVKNKQIMERIDVPKIKYINAEGNFCYLMMNGKEPIPIKISLRRLLNYFDKDLFIRTHKSYVVNLNYLDQVNIKDKTLMIGDENIPIGRTYYSELSNHLTLF